MRRTSVLLILAAFLLSVAPTARAQTTPPAPVAVDRQPVPATQAPPGYPAAARRDSVEGRVVLNVRVGPDGRVTDVRPERATTEQRGQALAAGNAYEAAFTEAAIVSARQWTFTPAMKDDQAVAVWMTLPMRFKLRRN